MFGPCTQYLPAVAGTAKTVALTRATRNDVLPKCMSISESSLSNQSCVLHFVPKLRATGVAILNAVLSEAASSRSAETLVATSLHKVYRTRQTPSCRAAWGLVTEMRRLLFRRVVVLRRVSCRTCLCLRRCAWRTVRGSRSDRTVFDVPTVPGGCCVAAPLPTC